LTKRLIDCSDIKPLWEIQKLTPARLYGFQKKNPKKLGMKRSGDLPPCSSRPGNFGIG